ncbi:hypothetical protein [Archangium violaceum]|uniref:Uncharacterized protein n=1 Tax=Archangium violaceum Cb vi76 TaxID=1406225 RepID=A0A084SQ94_9BACT|nr:hypothetical protein [Archangium violaceum]KFA90629.1 hypothetical protein Q664_27610 [Archangium violaceum Cb vi76]
MYADLPPAYHLVLAQAPTPPASQRFEVPPQRAAEVRSPSLPGPPSMLVIGTPEAAFLWPLATLTPPDTEQMVISAKLVHPAWNKRKPPFSSDGYILEAAEPFELSAVREGTLKSFKVSISRPGAASPEWKDVEVQVKAVPWHSQLVPNSATVPRLLYRLFGSPGATFLVHELSGSPDFHHVVRVKFKDRRFTQEELSRGLLVDVEDRPNVKGAKLQMGDAPKGSLLDGKPVKFKVERELLFREVGVP